MGITKTTDLTNSVGAVYEKKYYMFSLENTGVWGQFIDWQTPVSEDGGSGSSFIYPIYGETDLVESPLTEDADVTPDTISDGAVTLTPYEYGKTFAITKLARYQSRTNLATVMGELIAKNRINSIDRILRRGATGRGATYPTMTVFLDLEHHLCLPRATGRAGRQHGYRTHEGRRLRLHRASQVVRGN
jgi:hypothetical protein